MAFCFFNKIHKTILSPQQIVEIIFSRRHFYKGKEITFEDPTTNAVALDQF